MKKIVISLLIVLIIGVSLIFTVFNKKNESSSFKKITVADTTLTSRTYMS